MKKIIGMLLVLGMMSCSTSKIKIGDYTYEVKMQRTNTGALLHRPKWEFGVPGDLSTFKWVEKGDSLPIISLDKIVYFRGEAQCGCGMKSQKFKRMKKTDSIYQKGQLYIMGNLLICVEKYYHGYRDNVIILRILEQQKNGALRFKKYIEIPVDEYRGAIKELKEK